MGKSVKSGLFSAVVILSVFTIADRFLGFVFKIFLSRQLSAVELGIYQVALSFFFVLLTATTSGIPLVVSKLTAKYRLGGELKREQRLVSAALISGLVAAAALTVLIVALYKPIQSIFASDKSAYVLLLLLPALFTSAVYSAFRGNLWGRERYFAVAVVELIEQIARILTCIILFAVGLNKLNVTAFSLPVGCAVSTAVVVIYYFAVRSKLAPPEGEFKLLIRSAAPITVSRAASSAVGSLIAIAVPFLLTASGHTAEEALAIYGSSLGMAMPLLYIPITVVGSLAFTLIPSVSAKLGAGDMKAVNAQIENAIGFSVIIAALFVPMFSALGEPIGRFVYGSADAGRFLSSAAWLLVPLSVESITSSVMNSLDLELRSFANYIVGSAVSFIILFAFYGQFNILVLGYALGIGWSVTCVLNVLAMRKKCGLGFGYAARSIKAILLTVPSTLVTKAAFSLLGELHLFWSISIASVLGIVFFALGALLFDVIEWEKLNFLPKKRGFSKKSASDA